MAQIIKRINRLIKSEINYSQSKMDIGQHPEFTDFSAGLDNNFSVSTIPLSAANALTGISLYEAIKLIVEGESFTSILSSYNFGVTTLNSLISQGITMKEILDLAVEDMEQELVSTREATVSAMSIEKINRKKYDEAQAEFKKWQYRTILAIEKDNDYLAQEALKRKKFFSMKVNNLKVALKEQIILSNCLKLSLFALSNKIAEANDFKANFGNSQFQELSNTTTGELIDIELESLRRQLDEILFY
jgi:hypothetical protein